MITNTQTTATQVPTIDFSAIKQRQQQTWNSGDFDRIATLIMITSELLCEAVDLHPGQAVLDVATGSGNTAISAARRFCRVTGIDYVPALLERARAKAAFEQLNITFTEGDAEAIPVPDGSFDAVLSTFGCMFAPNQEKAASELLRACKPGGKIGMANWTPTGFVGGIFRVTSRLVAPPAGIRPPVQWGTAARLQELFGDAASSIEIEPRMFVFRFLSADHFVDYFRTYYGPTLKAFAALDDAGKEALANDLRELAHSFNRSGDDTMIIPAEYLEVVITKN
ncbi:MAG: class I SAM-dependent methyltransferase [Chloroflexota bacterium]